MDHAVAAVNRARMGNQAEHHETLVSTLEDKLKFQLAVIRQEFEANTGKQQLACEAALDNQREHAARFFRARVRRQQVNCPPCALPLFTESNAFLTTAWAAVFADVLSVEGESRWSCTLEFSPAPHGRSARRALPVACMAAGENRQLYTSSVSFCA